MMWMMWTSSSPVREALKAMTKRDEKKEKDEVGRERTLQALMPALCGSGVQMTCA